MRSCLAIKKCFMNISSRIFISMELLPVPQSSSRARRATVHEMQHGFALEQMKDITQRRAALVSTLVAVRHADDPEPLIASGRAVGEITRELRGDKGFGFDPVMFIPEMNMTFAEMSEAEKNARSHRGQAARLMVELMQQRWQT